MTPTRGETLIDLADAINELTRPRTTSEYVEMSIVRTVTTRSGKIRSRRTRERRRHVVHLPSLLVELGEAAIPGSSEGGAAAGGFESRPSAELDPVSVLREIDDDAGFWARAFDIDEPTLSLTLQALISVNLDTAQLEHITRQAGRWVHRARVATGHELAPKTLSNPCPYCWRRNALVVSGDLRSAKCERCGTRWSPDTIGLLADMLRASETQETAVAVACWMPDCRRRGVHVEHGDDGGRTWSDTCAVGQ